MNGGKFGGWKEGGKEGMPGGRTEGRMKEGPEVWKEGKKRMKEGHGEFYTPDQWVGGFISSCDTLCYVNVSIHLGAICGAHIDTLRQKER